MFVYFIPILIGYLFLRPWRSRINFSVLEHLGLGYGLGTIVITFSLFILSFLGFRFSQLNIIILSVGLLIISFAISHIFRPFKAPQIITFRVTIRRVANLLPCLLAGRQISKLKTRKNWLKIIGRICLLILVLIIIFKIGYVFTEAYLRPVIQFDAVTNWSLRAKIFFFQERIPTNPQEPYWLGAGEHENYPLHLPLLELWATKILGLWHEPTIKIISPFYFLSLLIVFYFALARLIRKKYAIIFTFFLATLPFFNYHAFAAYADVPLSFYLTTAVILFFLGLRENNRAYFSLATLFCFGAAWIKNEGLFLSLIIFTVFYLYSFIRKKFKSGFIVYSLWFIVLLLPWLLFMMHHHLGFSNVSLDQPGGFGFYPEAFRYVWTSLVLDSGWHILWLMLILTFISWPKRFVNQSNLFLFFIFLGFLAFYFGLYCFISDIFEYLKMGVIFDRNLLTIAPLTLFLVANVFGKKY